MRYYGVFILVGVHLRVVINMKAKNNGFLDRHNYLLVIFTSPVLNILAIIAVIGFIMIIVGRVWEINLLIKIGWWPVILYLLIIALWIVIASLYLICSKLISKTK